MRPFHQSIILGFAGSLFLSSAFGQSASPRATAQSTINNTIKSNGTGAITGPILNNALSQVLNVFDSICAFSGPTCTLVPSTQLPAPSASSLGGTFSATAPNNQYQTGVTTLGAPTFGQPTFSGIAGAASAAQTPTACQINGNCAITVPTQPITDNGGNAASSAFLKNSLSYVNAGWYGAQCNTLFGGNAAITSGATTVSGPAFVAGDVGKIIDIVGAGASGAVLETTITAVSGGTATIATPASATVSGAAYSYGNDDTAAIQAALNTGKTTYVPKLGGLCHWSSITITTCGQIVFGDGRLQTQNYTIKPTTTPGTIVSNVPLSCSGPDIRDIGLYYYQPDAATGLVLYPPALFQNYQNRVQTHRMGIYCPGIGISKIGTNDSVDEDLQLSAFQIGINIDQVTDLMNIRHLKWFPYSCVPGGGSNSGLLTNNQFSAWWTQGTGQIIGINTARVDGLNISDSVFLGGLGINAYTSTTGAAPGFTVASITNTDCDTTACMVLASGQFMYNGGEISFGVPVPTGNSRSITNTGANLSIVGTWIFAANPPGGQPLSSALIYTTGSGDTSVIGSPYASMGNADQPMFQVVSRGVFSNNLTFRANGVSSSSPSNYTTPFIYSTGRLTAIGNIMGDPVNSSGTFIRLDDDGQNRVIGNSSTGWTYICPSSSTTLLQPSAACPSPGTSYYAGN